MRAAKRFYQRLIAVFDRVTDILVLPLLVLAVFAAVVMFNAKRNNLVPSLFGTSAVVILSGSMHTDDTPQFAKGKTVLLKKADPQALAVGDIIAYYQVKELTNEKEYDDDSLKFHAANADVVFHRIVEIEQAQNGRLFFHTKGDANPDVDQYLIRQEFVIGKYSGERPFAAWSLRFAASPAGITFLVILPSGVMLIMELLVLMEILDEYGIQSKILKLLPQNERLRLKYAFARIGAHNEEYERAYLNRHRAFFEPKPDETADKKSLALFYSHIEDLETPKPKSHAQKPPQNPVRRFSGRRFSGRD